MTTHNSETAFVTTSQTTDAHDDFDELDDLLRTDDADGRLATAYDDAVNRANLLRDLIKLRKALGLTQKTVADRMQTTQSAVSEFENSQSDYFISTAQRYARAVTGHVRLSLEMPCDGPWGQTRSAYVRRESALHKTSIRVTSPTAAPWRASLASA